MAAPASRARIVAAHALVVLGPLVAAVALAAGCARWQLFDEDTFGETASDLIANDTIRNEVAIVLVEQLFANVDVKAELEQRLPEKQSYLAGPLAAGARQVADRTAQELLERPRIQALWRDSLIVAQRQLERVLDDDATAVQTEGGYVVLNLQPLVIQLGDQIAIVGNLASKLPDTAGRVKIMKADQLESAQDLTQLFKSVAAWVWLVPFVLWGVALWLARGRRRTELRAVAWAIVAAGVLVLVGREIGGRYVVDALAGTAATEEASESAWGIAAALLLLLVWWGPTAQTRRPLQVLFAAILLGVGVEALRRITRRDFPEASEVAPGAALRGVLSRGGSSAPPEPDRVTELERLARLKEAGVLTDEELAAEKARLLGSSG